MSILVGVYNLLPICWGPGSLSHLCKALCHIFPPSISLSLSHSLSLSLPPLFVPLCYVFYSPSITRSRYNPTSRGLGLKIFSLVSIRKLFNLLLFVNLFVVLTHCSIFLFDNILFSEDLFNQHGTDQTWSVNTCSSNLYLSSIDFAVASTPLIINII